jgi:hypothetical protein
LEKVIKIQQEYSMTEELIQPRVSRIYRYLIASSDMYYTELEQRDIFVQDDPDKGFEIWGEIAGAGKTTSIGLCQMFLEYGMYCRSWGSLSESTFHMRTFGENIGTALANFIQETPPAEMDQNPGICTLMCLWESLKIQFTVEHVGSEMHFLFANCPLEEIARQTGMLDVDLALYGVNALCQTLIHTIDPYLEILTPLESRPDFVFSVRNSQV